MTPPRRVLVVIPRRIGDVLLATPLMRSLKLHWPDVAIDALVFAGTEGVLAGNPDVRRCLTIAERPTLLQHLGLLCRIARRYDVALSLLPGDRPALYAWLAGRTRAGLVIDEPAQRWKKWLLRRWVPFDDLNTHTVLMHLALIEALGIDPSFDVVVGIKDTEHSPGLPSINGPYAVLHTFPKFNYKMWHREGWWETARWLQTQGLKVVLTGGASADELAYVADVAVGISDVINVAGRLTLAESARLLAGASVYVGPDTALTHVAAALGIPVVALYGPTNTVKWGPWPAGHTRNANPWRRHGSQRQGNVTLLQGAVACVPCLKEGCDRHVASYSDCLQQLPARRVIAALREAMVTPLPPMQT